MFNVVLALVLSVFLVGSANAGVQADQDPKAILNRFEDQIAKLLEKPQPDLFSWHLRSLRSLAEIQYAQLSLDQKIVLRRPHAEHVKDFCTYLGAISKGFDGDCSEPDPYLKAGERPLILAHNSVLDGTVQYMMVGLPKDWDPNRAYPLMVNLHGTGPDNPLAYPSYGLAPRTGPDQPSNQPPMISLTPWGRGNRGWRNDSEVDLFEAIQLLQTFCKTDRDRWYLTGHSAGGDGSWAIVQHTPDLWAAAGMQAGSMGSAPPSMGLLDNMRYVPFHILIGGKDPSPNRIPDSKEAYRLLKAKGDETELVIAPDAAHYPLPADALDEQVRWMMSHVRKRPNRFSFVADQAVHPGVWGISVVGERGYSRIVLQPWPQFECEVHGRGVEIRTKHIKKLRVDLGDDGLKMAGSVILRVNGQDKFDGPVPEKPLTITVDAS